METEDSSPFRWCPPVGPIVSQLNPVHTFTRYFFVTNSHIILSLRLVFSSGVFLSGCLTNIFIISHFPARSTRSVHLILLDSLVGCSAEYCGSINGKSITWYCVIKQHADQPTDHVSTCSVAQLDKAGLCSYHI